MTLRQQPPVSRQSTARFHGPALVVAALLLAAAVPAPAQMLADPELEALYRAQRPAELQRVARLRLAAAPDDSDAVLALALAALERDDASARKEALDSARACTARQPRAQPCHYAHGTLLGVQAMNDGLLAAARSAGTVREALETAYALNPAWYPGRSALLEFHVLAPGFMGGSTAKAAELAQAAPRPEQAAALRARVLLGDKQWTQGLALLLPLLPVADAAMRDDVIQWGSQAGLALVNDGLAAQAQPWFERLQREHADHAAGPYGLARVKGELGDWAGALALLERAGALKGAAAWPLDYRIGIALQQLGRADAARAALRRFVDAGTGQKAALEDARKRLATLAPG